MFRNHWFLYSSVLVLSVLDILTTVVSLENGGVEANPLARFLINEFGYWSMPFLKAGSLLVLTYSEPLLTKLENKSASDDYKGFTQRVRDNFNKYLFTAVFVVYLLVVVNNILVLKMIF